MDILSHLLWAYLIFPDSEYKFLALIFAVLPDVIGTIPFLTYGLFTGSTFKILKEKKGIVPRMPNWLIEVYRYFHSIPLIFLVTLLLYLFHVPGIIILYIAGSWFFHVGTDIFLHDETYIKTPFLHPFSTFSINGINWASPKYLVLNYTLIIVLLALKFLA